jgi:integrase/recombinase XerD
VEESSPTPAGSPLERFLTRYKDYLERERSLAPRTVHGYLDEAGKFVAARCGGDPARLPGLVAGDVTHYVLFLSARGLSPRTVNESVVRLRSLLRFLYLKGVISAPLAQATPWMANSRAGSLPRGLEPGVTARLLDSCDRGSVGGVRDYAILLLLSRLCLRAGEVAALELSDIDWRRGEITVSGKGGRRDALPLPVEVGEALADYLRRRGAAAPGCRRVFLHVRVRRDGLQLTDINATMRRACWRAGVEPLGTHRFRHAAACELLAAGAPLHEIGELLRHGVVATTAIYAKVDFAALGGLARPWPVQR